MSKLPVPRQIVSQSVSAVNKVTRSKSHLPSPDRSCATTTCTPTYYMYGTTIKFRSDSAPDPLRDTPGGVSSRLVVLSWNFPWTFSHPSPFALPPLILVCAVLCW